MPFNFFQLREEDREILTGYIDFYFFTGTSMFSRNSHVFQKMLDSLQTHMVLNISYMNIF